MKFCISCEEEKPIEDFHRQSNKPDGRATYCKLCKKKRAAIYYERRAEQTKERVRAYRAINLEEIRAKDVTRARVAKAANPEEVSRKKREYQLLKNFGITLDTYNELLEAQGGCCAICKKTPEQEGRSLAVEHDHKSGQIMGIVCYRCNHKLLGNIRDPLLFEKAAEFLRGGTGLYVPPKTKKRRTRASRKKTT